MTKRLTSVAPLQLGIVLGALYVILSLIVVPFLIIGALISARSGSGQGTVGAVILLIFIPVLYGVIGFVGGVIAGAVYNLIAKWTGGIEFTLSDKAGALETLPL